jgi:hypothetical protein
MRKALWLLTISLFLVITLGLTIVYAGEFEIPQFDPANFTSPQDNDYFPMAAIGKIYVYEAETDGEIERNVTFFSPDTIVIQGVTCIVVHDVASVYVEELGKWFVVEETDDWYAWDNDGNVWYFGEDTVAFIYDENWNPAFTSTEGSWKAGEDGATAGIVMLADPRPGISYRQEYYEDEAEDEAKVLRLNAKVTLENGESYEDCLETKEWTRLDPGHIEHKFYAPGVGLIFVEELKGKTVHVNLIDIFPTPPN